MTSKAFCPLSNNIRLTLLVLIAPLLKLFKNGLLGQLKITLQTLQKLIMVKPRLKYEKALVRYYNRISGNSVYSVDEIPTGALQVLQFLTYEELIKPFIAEDLLKGLGRNVVKRKYACRTSLVRFIGERLKVYKLRY